MRSAFIYGKSGMFKVLTVIPVLEKTRAEDREHNSIIFWPKK